MVAVPNVPGVPTVAFSPVIGAAASLLTGDDLGTYISLFSPQWGVFDSDGNAVVVADIVSDLSHKEEYVICNYPVEDGGFASFNKVQTPYQARVRFAAGGSEAARSALLASIDDVIADLNLYDVVTPEQTYQNANFIRREYRRVAQEGVSLLIVDVVLEEVRVVDDGSSMSSTQQPSGADPTNGGTVQPTTPTATQTSLANTPGSVQ